MEQQNLERKWHPESVGTFPNSNNPNSISAQNVSESFTLCPSIIYESGLEVVGPAMAVCIE